MEIFEKMDQAGLIQLRVMKHVGCERFAEWVYNLINDIAEILYPYGIQQERIEYFAELVLDGYPSYYWLDTWDDYLENGDDTIVRNKLDVLIGAMINAAENQLM